MADVDGVRAGGDGAHASALRFMLAAALCSLLALAGKIGLRLWRIEAEVRSGSADYELWAGYALALSPLLLIGALVRLAMLHRARERGVLVAAAVVAGLGFSLRLYVQVLVDRGFALRESINRGELSIDDAIAIAQDLDAKTEALGAGEGLIALGAGVLALLVVARFSAKRQGSPGIARPYLIALAGLALAYFGLRAWLLADPQGGQAMRFLGDALSRALPPTALVLAIAGFWETRFAGVHRLDFDEALDIDAIGQSIAAHGFAVVGSRLLGLVLLALSVGVGLRTSSAVMFVQCCGIALGAWVVASVYRLARTLGAVGQRAEAAATLSAITLVVQGLGVALVAYTLSTLDGALELEERLARISVVAMLFGLAALSALTSAFEDLAHHASGWALVKQARRLKGLWIVIGLLELPRLFDAESLLGNFHTAYAMAVGLLALAGLGLYLWLMRSMFAPLGSLRAGPKHPRQDGRPANAPAE